MPEGNQEFRLKKIDEIRNHLIEKINQNKLVSQKHKELCRVLNYIDHSLIVIYTITGCVLIPSSAIGLKTYVLIPGIK